MNESTRLNAKQEPYSLFAGMKIRKKLVVLHTLFSICLGVLLLVAIRPAMTNVIVGIEQDESQQLADMYLSSPGSYSERLSMRVKHVQIGFLGEQEVQRFSHALVEQAHQSPERAVPVPSNEMGSGVIRWLPDKGEYLLVRSFSERARKAIWFVYALVIGTLIAGYTFVALALELFVLPKHVYHPLRTLLKADKAVREGDLSAQLIDDQLIPADELGMVMRSRNESISALRTKEIALAQALERLEKTAVDLHKKNHLLEAAKRNLEGADRLASLGMMSAGIAHELNTPLAVVKGLIDKLSTQKELSDQEIALIARVVGRLEKLSEGLLDFARVRPPANNKEDIWNMVDEAVTLVSFNRKELIDQRGLVIENRIERGTHILCDPHRIVQVFVNLIRNGVDALIHAERTAHPQLVISAEIETRDESPWVVIRIEDNGPGIDSAIIDRLFEPFVSSRLDSHGTGLGLAVANGIVREHGGVLVAMNRSVQEDCSGAVFEVLLQVAN